MFLSHKFLKYGKPLTAAAPIMLALSGLPTPAHACTGSPDDPPHCINANQAINTFTSFYTNNLAGLPGSTGVPGDRVPGNGLGGILDGFAGLGGGGIIIASDPSDPEPVAPPGFLNEVGLGPSIDLNGSGEPGDTNDNGIAIFVSGDFGTVTLGDTDGALDWALREAANIDNNTGNSNTGGDERSAGIRYDYDVDVEFNFSGTADNGLNYSTRIRIDDEEEPAATPRFNIRMGGLIHQDALSGGSDVSSGGLVDSRPDSEVFFLPAITLDNGIKISGEIQLESSGNLIDEYTDRISGSFGEIRIGDENSGGYIMSYGAPSVDEDPNTEGDRADYYSDSDLEAARNGILRPLFTSDNGLTFAIDVEAGVGAAAADTPDGPQVKYFTPRFTGYQIGVSYTTEGNKNFGVTSPDQASGQTFDIGVNYVNSFGGINPALSSRWGITEAAANFAVGSASIGQFGGDVGLNIDRVDFTPLDQAPLGIDYKLDRGDFGLRVNYGLSGSVTTTPTTTTTTAAPPAPPPPAPVTGEQVGTMKFLHQREGRNVNLVRAGDGKVHAVDADSGHDYGTVHESRSGFGWSFDNAPVSPPVATPTPPVVNAVAESDNSTIFQDGFESGDTAAWSYVGR